MYSLTHSTPTQGQTVMKGYLNQPAATAQSFDPQGYFKTGDIAAVDTHGYYRILGRNSTDIIKVNTDCIVCVCVYSHAYCRVTSIVKYPAACEQDAYCCCEQGLQYH